uniref:Uncharacterized protein n=1 Tax=Acanthochromis polyacanthus TaxID=80966 RepID=A0A3Q1FDG2_9TELE
MRSSSDLSFLIDPELSNVVLFFGHAFHRIIRVLGTLHPLAEVDLMWILSFFYIQTEKLTGECAPLVRLSHYYLQYLEDIKSHCFKNRITRISVPHMQYSQLNHIITFNSTDLYINSCYLSANLSCVVITIVRVGLGLLLS